MLPAELGPAIDLVLDAVRCHYMTNRSAGTGSRPVILPAADVGSERAPFASGDDQRRT